MSSIASIQCRENGRPVVGHVSGTVVRDVSGNISLELASLVSRFRLQPPCLIGQAMALVPPLLARLAALLIGKAIALVPQLLERLAALLIRLAVALVPPLLERLAALLVAPTPALLVVSGSTCR